MSRALHSSIRPVTRPVLAGLLAGLQVLFGVPLIGWLAPSDASAQTPPPRVWVGPIDPGEAAGAGLLSKTLDESARKDLIRRPAVETTDQETLGSITAGDEDPRVEHAERLRVAAKEALRRGETAPALEQLRAALELYEAGLASVNKMEAVLETLGYLGSASQISEYDADAKDFFRRVIAMAPDAEPLDEFPPEAQALFRKEKTRLLKKKRGRLKIVTDPPGATVRLDGVDVGTSPVTLRKLVRGEHYVQAAHDEAGLAATKVTVKGGRTASVQLTLSTEIGPPPVEAATEGETKTLVALARSGTLGAPFREMAEAVATKTRADYVVVSYVSPRGNGFVLDAYIYGVSEKQTAAFDEFAFRADLASVAVQANRFADAVTAAVTTFPEDKVIIGGRVAVKEPAPPPIAPPPVEPDPVPAPAPAPEPAPIAPPPPERAPVVNRSPVPVERRADDNDDDDDDDGVGVWVWVVLGVAVAGGAAATAVILSEPGEPSDQFDAEVRW